MDGRHVLTLEWVWTEDCGEVKGASCSCGRWEADGWTLSAAIWAFENHAYAERPEFSKKLLLQRLREEIRALKKELRERPL